MVVTGSTVEVVVCLVVEDSVPSVTTLVVSVCDVDPEIVVDSVTTVPAGVVCVFIVSVTVISSLVVESEAGNCVDTISVSVVPSVPVRLVVTVCIVLAVDSETV